jgi:hypothetical protein
LELGETTWVMRNEARRVDRRRSTDVEYAPWSANVRKKLTVNARWIWKWQVFFVHEVTTAKVPRARGSLAIITSDGG